MTASLAKAWPLSCPWIWVNCLGLSGSAYETAALPLSYGGVYSVTMPFMASAPVGQVPDWQDFADIGPKAACDGDDITLCEAIQQIDVRPSGWSLRNGCGCRNG